MSHDHNEAARRWYRNLSPEKKAEYNRKSMERTRKYRAEKREVLAIAPRKCEGCGKEFETRANNVRFCSRSCYMKFRLAKDKANYVSRKTLKKKVCPFCGKEFETTHNFARFCSAACRKHAQYHGSLEEMQSKLAAKEEAARTRKIVESGGMTQEQRNAVIWAQSSDQKTLWRASQSWTPAQRKFARERWEELHPSHRTAFWE